MVAPFKIVNGQAVPRTEAEIAWLAALQAAASAPRVEDFQRAIEAHVDAKAREKGYSSAVSCASYAISTNPTYGAEALAFIAWRDAVWVYALAELAKVQGGQRTAPTVADLISELPAMVWP